MKPACQSVPRRRVAFVEFPTVERQFPLTDYCFYSGVQDWRGYSSPHGEDDGLQLRNFLNLSREFFGAETRRERVKEMIVFGLIAATSAWPVIYMVVTVVKVLSKEHP